MRRMWSLTLSVTVMVVGLFGADAPSDAQAATVISVAAAGDIACQPGKPPTATTCNQAATAALIGRIAPSQVLALGDLVYPSGSLANFLGSYDPTWGAFKSKTRPVVGNHETGSPGETGYYQYFGSRATPLQPSCRSSCKGYYSYSTGSWHVVALNTSSCSESTGTCASLAAQAAWLEQDLAAHPNNCTLAIMHHPLFSGTFGATSGVRPLWAVMRRHGVDLVVAGHAHNYQRFVPQDESGNATPTGITEIIAGTGGASLQTLTTAPNQAAHVNHAFGVLALSLTAGAATTSLKTTDGRVLDTTVTTCH